MVAPQSEFDDVVSPVALALEQEKRVTQQINALAGVAREQGDYCSEQFMQWFIKEQIEEVATMSDLLRIVERARDNPLLAEEYLAREPLGEEGADPTAPPVAGGALTSCLALEDQDVAVLLAVEVHVGEELLELQPSAPSAFRRFSNSLRSSSSSLRPRNPWVMTSVRYS